MSDAMDWRSLTPPDSPKGLPEVFADPVLTDLRTPDVAQGDEAFDFDLAVYDFSSGHKTPTAERVRLWDAAEERPVALIFGSYT